MSAASMATPPRAAVDAWIRCNRGRKAMKPLLADLGQAVRSARTDLMAHVQPRDKMEQDICNALGECSWDECVTAIQRYRAEQEPQGDAGG
jgi:hypothetical protein